MRVRSCATFTSDLPDDHIENEAGTEIVQFGGKSVAEAVGEILTRLGCVVDPPRYADEHGWEVDVHFGKRQLWVQVTLIEGYVMHFEDVTFMSGFMGRRHPLYLEMLTRLAHALASDPRFHDVLWFYQEDVLSDVPGCKEPLAAADGPA